MIEITERDKEIMCAAVKTTATKLFEVLPKWPSFIDWERFDFSNAFYCIRGQLFGQFEKIVIDMYDSPGFDVPIEIKSTFSATNFKWPIELWQFMEAEWRKYAI